MPSLNPEAAPAGHHAYTGLDRVLHEKARLGILTALSAAGGPLSFAELKELCALTDGNLNRHLHTLEEADLVHVSKARRGARGETRAALSERGEEAFVAYLEELERVLRDARGHQQALGRFRPSNA